MNCICSPATIGFDTSTCLVHGPGGLRDLREERIEQWKKDHPIRWWLHKRYVRIKYRGLFKETK